VQAGGGVDPGGGLSGGGRLLLGGRAASDEDKDERLVHLESLARGCRCGGGDLARGEGGGGGRCRYGSIRTKMTFALSVFSSAPLFLESSTVYSVYS
jgi:hypothetical protein